MAEIRLGRTNRQGGAATGAVNIANRRSLDRIADRGAGAMGLDKCQIVYIKMQVLRNPAHQAALTGD